MPSNLTVYALSCVKRRNLKIRAPESCERYTDNTVELQSASMFRLLHFRELFTMVSRCGTAVHELFATEFSARVGALTRVNS